MSSVNNNLETTQLSLPTSLSPLKSPWTNISKWGIFGERRRMVIKFDDKGDFQEIKLIAQTAFGRMISFIGKPFGLGKNSGKTVMQLPKDEKTLEVWKNACQNLGLPVCKNIVIGNIQTLISKTPKEMIEALNQGLVASLNQSMSSFQSLQYLTSEFTKHLDHFYSSIEKEWNLFVQEKLNPSCLNPNLIALTKEVLSKQNEILEKCRCQCIEQLEKAVAIESSVKLVPIVETQAGSDFVPLQVYTISKQITLSTRFSKFRNQSESIDLVLNHRQKVWSELQEKIQSADSIEKLDQGMDDILDSEFVDDALFELLNENIAKGLDGCLEASQVKSKELLINLAPNNSTFQGFHSPRALTSKFLFEQIKSYQDPKTKALLSDHQKGILEDVNANIKCVELFEYADNMEKEKQKAFLFMTLSNVQGQLESAKTQLQDKLKTIFVDQYTKLDQTGMFFLHLLQTASSLLNMVSKPDINWKEIPDTNITSWTDNAKQTIETIQQILQNNVTVDSDDASSLNSQYKLNPLTDLLKTAPEPKDPLQAVLTDSFIKHIEQIRQSSLVDLSKLDPTEINLSAITADATTFNDFLTTTLSQCLNNPTESVLSSAIKRIIDSLSSSDILNKEALEKVSLIDLNQSIKMLDEDDQEDAASQKKIHDLKLQVRGATYSVLAAINAIQLQKKLMLFIANNSDTLKNNESVSKAKAMLQNIPLLNNAEQFPLKILVNMINFSLQKIEQADKLINEAKK